MRTNNKNYQPRNLCIAAAILLASGTAIAGPVQWKNDTGNTTKLSDQAPSAILQAAAQRNNVARNAQSIGERGYILVTLTSTPDQQIRKDLSAQGLELLSPVSGTTFFAHVAGDANINALSNHVVDAGEITQSNKLHPVIENDNMPSWAIVGADTVKQIDGTASDNIVAAYVVMHRDVDPASQMINQLVEDHDGEIRSVVMSMNTIVVELPYSQLKALANDERVQWVEPPLPPIEPTNASNRVVTQVNTAQSAPYSLDGSGVTVLVYDGGTVRATHQDFSSRATNIDSDAVSFHATHVAGTIGGAGVANSNHTGMAPAVTILGAGFEVAGGLQPGFLYTDPGDLEADYSLAMSMGAEIANNSIGSNVAQNGYPCEWHGDYGVTAGVIDNVIRGSLGDQITIYWAAGNERGNGRCGTSYGTTAPPGNNKNAISVGALNSNNDSMTGFSSWGPSDDGRLRPVISAPGCQSNGDGGVTSTDSSSDTAYSTLCGTSMASPTAAGIGALILEDFRNQYPSMGDPSNQLMKTILIQGAEDILNTGPDFQTGYGSMRAVDSIDFMRSGNFDEQVVDQGSSSTFTINVGAGDPALKITMVWDDPAGAPNVAPNLVNDLDLIVIDPNGVRHFPWTLNPANPNAAAVRNAEDHLNNIEQVQVDSPAIGTWQIQVTGTTVTDGPQSFAIASSSDLGDGLLSVSLNDNAPELILPGTPIDVTATITEGVDMLVPGSVELNYHYDNGSYTTVAMSDNGDGTFSATVPGANCSQFIEYFVTAEGTQAGQMSSPPAGAAGPTHTDIGEVVVFLTDDFEVDNGWTVSGDASDGQWTRGVPVNCSDRGAPGSDADGSGQCWVTDNSAASSCNSDVDSGTTTLTSPIYDLAAGGEFSYSYWFADIATGGIDGDEWAVDGSTDGGANWVRLRTVTTTAASWRSDTILIGDEIAATSNMRFRFSANDLGTQNVIEAGLDNLSVSQFQCNDVDVCTPDFNNDGTLNFFDISAFLAAFNNSDAAADINNDGSFNFFDISSYLTLFSAGCP
ncbi:MAG: S8 family serine peptidase [Phycisphaerales bacterium]|nr:S8 family serine peptidase [Phycisphaerales bacterium]